MRPHNDTTRNKAPNQNGYTAILNFALSRPIFDNRSWTSYHGGKNLERRERRNRVHSKLESVKGSVVDIDGWQRPVPTLKKKTLIGGWSQ